MTDQLLTISKAARLAGIAADTLRHYANIGIVKPVRDSDNRRLFTPQDVAAIRAYREQRDRRHK